MDGGGTVETERRRFPALDPEPPPQRWYERAGRAGVVVMALAVVTSATIFLVDRYGQTRRPAGASAPPVSDPNRRSGQVVVMGPGGVVSVTHVDGTGLTAMPALGQYSNQPLLPSLDGSVLVASDGTMLSVHNGHLSALPSRAATARQAEPVPDPLAGHDRYLIVGSQDSAEVVPGAEYIQEIVTPVHFTGTVAAIPVGSGVPVELGVADAVEGDPQLEGAFVSVPSAGSGPAGVDRSVLTPDDRIELRDAGRPAVILATDRSLNQALGERVSRPVSMVPFPSPDGDLVAVTVTDASGSSVSGGIVVIDRAGRVQFELPADNGPATGQALAWSPDGRSLAFESPGSGSLDLVVWTPGRPALTRGDPTPGDLPLHCLWAPDSSAVLCATEVPGGTVSWNVAGASGGPVIAFTGVGLPMAWLADPRP